MTRRTASFGSALLLGVVLLLAGGAQSADTFAVTILSQNSSTITLGWTPQPGYGYLFSANGVLVSRTNDPARNNVRFAKNSANSYDIDVIVKGANGHCCTPPPPPKSQCEDGVDNDGDGKTDYPADPGCLSATDNDETDPPTGTAPWLGSYEASYRNAQPGRTVIVPAGSYPSQNITWIPGRDTAAPVKFVPAGPVTINGEMDISASGVWIAGTATGTIQNWKARTYSITVTSDVEIWGEGPTNYPRNVTVEGVATRNLAVRSADNVTVRDMDVGPRLIDAPGCDPFENRLGANGSSGHQPNGVLWERVVVHDQNRTLAAANQGCHYGGLQWDYSQNVTIRQSVFERNVVYQVEVTGASNSTITGTSFSCPADNSWLGDRCDGQRPVQFRLGTWASFKLTNNLSANGPGGFYGCYESPCNFTGMTVSGNTDFPESTTAPPVP